MFRNIAVVALAGALLGSPAFARDLGGARDRDMTRAVERMQDPATQSAIANAVGSLTEALMQLRVAPFINAVNAADPDNTHTEVPDDATLADLTGRDGEDMSEAARAQTIVATRAMGAMAGAFAQMLPQLEAMAHDVEAQVRRDMSDVAQARD